MEDLKRLEKPAIFEMLQDFVFLDCVFTIKRQLSKVEDKMVLGLPAFCGLSVLLHELSKDRCIFNKDIDIKYVKFLREVRTLFLKQLPTQNSNTIKNTVSEMGIDLHNYVFDIIVSSNPLGEIYDINFQSFKLNNLMCNNYEMCEELAMFPRNISKKFFNELGVNYNSFMETIYKYIQEKIAQGTFIYNADSKTYATSLLFKESSNLSDQEKYYILYRYSLIKSFYLLRKVPDITLKLPNKNDEYLISTSFSAIKFQAMLICLLGDDFKDEFLKDTSLIVEIKASLDKVIENKDFFYKKNRAIRNNIHYYKAKISNDDYVFVGAYQELYFKAVLGVIEKYLNVDFGLKYRIAIAFAKLRHWCKK